MRPTIQTLSVFSKNNQVYVKNTKQELSLCKEIESDEWSMVDFQWVPM